MLSWFLMILFSILLGVVVTLVVQFYFLQKYFSRVKVDDTPLLKLPNEPFRLPQSLLHTLRTSSACTTKEGCAAMNVLFQFLFHELRDTEKIRKWFRNRLTVEFEELITRSAVGRMFGSIKIRDINLGTEFPIINGIVIDDVKINDEFSHIDSLDLKLDLSYKGGFRLIVDANMLLGKAAYLSVKVGEVEGHGRLQFTRLPYSHWSFSFYEEPRLELEVESQFQGRPLPQITTLISNQIRKAIRKKHTLPNYKLRYKPFFSIGDEFYPADYVPACLLSLNVHHLSRLHQSGANPVYCLIGVDLLPWVDIIDYGETSYYLLDVTVTKDHSQPIGITYKQEFSTEQNKIVVAVESSLQPELLPGDIVISVDGRKVVQASQIPKLMKSAAIEITVRIERKILEKQPIQRSRKLSASEGDSSGSSSISNSPAKQTPSDRKRSIKSIFGKLAPLELTSPATVVPRLATTKTVKSSQIVIMDDSMKLSVNGNDKFVNIAIRTVDSEQQDILIGYVNLALSKVLRSQDYLHCCQIKPPDSFAASNSRADKLSAQNGFIPILSYGDIVLSAELNASSALPSPVYADLSSGSGAGDFEAISRPGSIDKRHDFVRTHLQSQSQCQFCGKKIWWKDAEQCRDCKMTCHKKCVSKCKIGSVCPGVVKKEMGLGVIGSMTAATLDLTIEESQGEIHRNEQQRRTSVNPEIVMTASEAAPQIKTSTPVQSNTRKGLSSLLASVASAGKGLKRVGSAHSLQIPDDGGVVDGLSKSLPPSPQQTPTPSRKPSLPLELSEDISALLETLLQHGTDQGDMMCFAKASGKTLYEDLDLPQRKEKIQEMMNKLKSAIATEADVRFALEKDLSSKDPGNHTKAAFLLGKSDEKTQALTVLMLHFCAALQHIQDLEEQDLSMGS